MTSLDPRMTLTLSSQTLESDDSDEDDSWEPLALPDSRPAWMRREDQYIERSALQFALQAFERAAGMPPSDAGEALYLHAQAHRRAAELIDERARLIEATKVAAAAARVAKIRGSWDAPGFDACVKAEIENSASSSPGSRGIGECSRPEAVPLPHQRSPSNSIPPSSPLAEPVGSDNNTGGPPAGAAHRSLSEGIGR